MFSPQGSWWVQLLLASYFLVGFAGLVTNLVNLNRGVQGNKLVLPLASATWLNVLVMYFSFSTLIWFMDLPLGISIRDGWRESCCCSKLQSRLLVSLSQFYHEAISLFALLLVFGFFLGLNESAGGWALCLLSLSLLNMWLHRKSSSLSAYLSSHCQHEGNSKTADGSVGPDPCTAGPSEADYSPLPGDNDKSSVRLHIPPEGCAKFGRTFLVKSYFALQGLAYICTAMLLGGAWLGAAGWQTYTPDGTFVTITYPNGVSSQILTQCVGPVSSTLPTLWVEVGGGGHSMIDLWGFRDVWTSPPYARRYCSYDMPGTGWSSAALAYGQSGLDSVQLTTRIMDAVGETSPVICMGSMDDGPGRCLKFCLAYPPRCVAVVPVGWAAPGEFYGYGQYYGLSSSVLQEYAKSILALRLNAGNLVNFFGVGWGLVNSIITNPDYVPKAQARESLFLNVLNEKQWSTNCNVIYENLVDIASSEWLQPSIWLNPDNALPASIPVIGYGMKYTPAQLNQQCKDYGYPLNSKDCGYIYWIYNQTIANDYTIVNTLSVGGGPGRPNSQLILCETGCPAKGSFFLNQGSSIGWFAETLAQAVQTITK